MEPTQSDTMAALQREVLEPTKASFVGKSEIVDLLGVCLVAGENLFILGPPGTAKSAIVHEVAARMGGQSFEYLLTRFTEPSELFGPFDIRKLREGTLETNVEGMLPEASFVFLDELLNANSAILNSLLTVLHERVFRRGKERRALPLLCAVGASNCLPEDEALRALFDRFLLRVRCGYVDDVHLGDVLERGWEIEKRARTLNESGVSIEDVRSLHKLLPDVDLSPIRNDLVELVRKIRLTGLSLSDRRAVKVQRLIAASAILSGRLVCERSDLWVMRHVWDLEEQIEILNGLVNGLVGEASVEAGAHPGVEVASKIDAHAVGASLDSLRAELEHGSPVSGADDRLSALESQVEWVENEVSRTHLQGKVKELWSVLRKG